MIFDLESRIKNQNQWFEFDWNQILNQDSRIKNHKSESMRFFGSGLFIKIADVKIYRSLFSNRV